MRNKKFFKYSALSVTALSPLPILIACGIPVDSDELSKQKKEILANFETLSNNQLWDAILTSQYGSSLDGSSLENAFNDTQTKYFQDAWAAFDYYQAHTLANEKLFFVKAVNEWAGKGYLSQDGSPESNTQTIAMLQLEYGQSLTQDQFKLIWKNPNTKIQEQVKKMLIAKEYLTNSTEANIKKSKEWLDNENEDITTNEYHLVRTDNKDYFLNVHLLKKQVSDVWEFSSTEAAALATYSKFRIKDVNDFNLLSQTKISLVNKRQAPEVALATNDSIDTSKLFSHKGLQMNSTGAGDLSYTIANLKTQDTTFTGFLDNATNKIYSFNDFQKAFFFLNKREVVPTLVNESKTKNKFDIGVADFTLTGNNSEIKYELMAVYPDNSDKTNLKQAFVIIKMSMATNPEHSYVYRVAVNWNGDNVIYSPAIGRIVPPFNASISALTADAKGIKATYINKITPLATEVAIVGEGDERRIDNFFSLDKTPWSTEQQKTRLSFALSILTDTILTAALTFYEDLGFKIDQKNEDIFGKK